MAVTYGFYDSLNHDRLYNAQQMSAIFDGIINDGVFMSVGNQFHTVAGTGMQIIVKSGRAWFDSTWTLNDAEYPLSIDAADVLLTRIDAVVLEVNSEVATRANTIKVVKGTPASTPAKPTLTNTATIHQHALAYVTVAKNTTAITNSMIEIVVGKTETPYVTAILQTTDITDLFNKWENDFQVWFETVKGTLDSDVALNLQNQIDHCVKKADKATSADIEAGTADKWVDANLFLDTSIKIGYTVQDYTDRLRNNTNYQYITSTNAALDRSNYSKLFQLVKYKYGCYRSYHNTVSVESGMSSPPSESYNLHHLPLFRVLIYNGHVYTYTKHTVSGSLYTTTTIMKDDKVIYISGLLSADSNIREVTFVYNNRFYILFSNYSRHYVSCRYWDAVTEKWSNNITTYNSGNDDILVSEYVGDYYSSTSTIIIKSNNNIYCHVLNGGYRCLINVTNSDTITVTGLGSGLYALLHDNNKIYGISRNMTNYYNINPITGEATEIQSTLVPDHVRKILTAKYNNSFLYPVVRYTNSEATEYVTMHYPEIYGSFLCIGYYVKYLNGEPIVKDFDLNSYFTVGNYNNLYTAVFYMLYDFWFTLESDSSFEPTNVQIDHDPIYMSIIHGYTGINNYFIQPLYADPLTEAAKIYLPLSISYNENDTTASIVVYEYDGNFFNISPINTNYHMYMKVQ